MSTKDAADEDVDAPDHKSSKLAVQTFQKTKLHRLHSFPDLRQHQPNKRINVVISWRWLGQNIQTWTILNPYPQRKKTFGRTAILGNFRQKKRGSMWELPPAWTWATLQAPVASRFFGAMNIENQTFKKTCCQVVMVWSVFLMCLCQNWFWRWCFNNMCSILLDTSLVHSLIHQVK